MPAYWIAHATVLDEKIYGEYAKLASKAIADHGGTFLARGGKHLTMEGQDHPRNVVIQFATMEDAVSCYRSSTYQDALVFAEKSSTRSLCIVEGC